MPLSRHDSMDAQGVICREFTQGMRMLDAPRRPAHRHRQARRSISSSTSRRSRRRAWSCASTVRSTRTPSCIRWCAGSSPGGLPGGSAPRLPVHQCGRLRRPQVRHAGRGRRARGVPAHLLARHGQAGRGDREPPGRNAIANPIPPVRVTSPPCQEVVITGRRPARRRARASPRCRCRSRRRATMSRPISPRRSRSRAIRRAASRTWAPIAAS